jgi:hypothetical protein
MLTDPTFARLRKRTAALAMFALLSLAIWSAPETARATAAPSLDDVQRTQLRSRLDRIYYEQDLMIRNARGELADLARQERQFEELKVFERIPFREDIPGLRSDLKDSAREQGLKLLSFKRHQPPRDKTPSILHSMYSDENPRFKLTDEQLAQKIPFTAVVQGDKAAVLKWIAAWPDQQMRLTRPETRDAEASIRPAGSGRWAVRAHAFRFKEAKFPALEPRDPFTLLPAWAQADPERFAQAQPVLWELVAKTRAITPQARPLFRTRERMLLNGARMSYFLRHVSPGTRN